jgi:hypothetical protein
MIPMDFGIERNYPYRFWFKRYDSYGFWGQKIKMYWTLKEQNGFWALVSYI